MERISSITLLDFAVDPQHQLARTKNVYISLDAFNSDSYYNPNIKYHYHFTTTSNKSSTLVCGIDNLVKEYKFFDLVLP
jgi:hypothetical protein